MGSSHRASSGTPRQTRLIGGATALVGVAIALYEFAVATYVVIGTLIVLAVVWPMLRARVRKASRKRRQVMLAAGVAIGFWVTTTTALRFADSSDLETGIGSASMVSVSPWGGEMNARDLMVHGVTSALAFALIGYGVLLGLHSQREHSRRHRGHEPGRHHARSAASQVVE